MTPPPAFPAAPALRAGLLVLVCELACCQLLNPSCGCELAGGTREVVDDPLRVTDVRRQQADVGRQSGREDGGRPPIR